MKAFFISSWLCLWFVIGMVTSNQNAIAATTSEEEPSQYLQLSSDTAYLSFDINFVYRVKADIEFQPLTEDSVLHSGDYYKIIFTPKQDSYVYIFQIDSSGKIYRLFPMKRFDGVTVDNFNPLKAGRTYYIPAEYQSFILDEQTGIERIYFLSSQKRDAALEVPIQGDNVSDELAIIDQLLELAERSKGIASVASDPAETEEVIWQEGDRQYSVLRERLQDMCDGCVYELIFEHQ